MSWVVNFGVNLVVIAVAIFVGSILSAHLQTTSVPLVKSILNGMTIPSLWDMVAVPIIAGLVLGMIFSPSE